jgi:Nucleoside-diphosphate-sugar epimerases
MKVIILGADGYLGWPLSLRLLRRGHQVVGVDNLATRRAVEEVGSDSALPIPSPKERERAARELGEFKFVFGDVTDYKFVRELLRKENPDAVVHFAEQRSAPYSMRDVEHAVYTMHNNLEGTLNLIYAVKEVKSDIHIVKMGTMGEYGTPNFDIPESAFVEVEINGRRDRIPTPKFAGSWYHWTKVYDTYNMLFANKVWGLTFTDIMQGPVYGTRTEEITGERFFTRFDFDEVWGTVVNRYCVEAVLGLPLTPYGKGGQTRGFLSLEDSVEALRILIENPPKQGEYRHVNQFVELRSVREIATFVQEAARELGLDVKVEHVPNPRVEAEEHYYNPELKVLPSLGFRPKKVMREEVKVMIKDLLPFKEGWQGTPQPLCQGRDGSDV